VVAWLAVSGAIAAYVSVSGEFSAIYGPLAGIMVLLLWAFVSGVALVAGFAVSAQLEAVRAGVVEPLLTDRDDDGVPDHLQPAEQHTAGG
jgi:uncharacterized BrkB/YihY/UPF0761 family membrane protein